MNNKLAFFENKYFMMLMAVALCLLSSTVFAESSGGNMPWNSAISNLRESITGPVAFAIALLGIVSCGAMLMFGAEISGVLKSVIILVLVVSIIVGANNMMTSFFGASAVIDANLSVEQLQSLSALK